jgi:hypothetical protein
MGCNHSSSPPNSPKQIKTKSLKNKIFIQHSQKTKSSISLKFSSFNIEQILDGHGKNLIKRLEFNSPCLLFDLSSTHILLLANQQLNLININTMNINTLILPNYNLDIQEIVWSGKLNSFLILTTDQLYQTDIEQLQLKSIQQIEV